LFGAMRRALVVAGVMLAGLLAAGPASARPAHREIEREVTFALQAEGFKVVFDTTDNDGRVSAYLGIARGGLTASYQVPATVTADTVKARFGSLGEVDLHYAPRRGGDPDCSGAENGEATFDGTFTFTGENGYIHIDVDHAVGGFQVYPEPKSCSQARRLRRVVPYSPSYSSKGATLHASAGSRRHGPYRELLVLDGGRRPHGGTEGALVGQVWEAREGMSIGRGGQVPLRAGAFRWSLKSGVATLTPPAPFTGSAHFVRPPGGRSTWTGSLGVPVLGGEPVELAGPKFHAYLRRGVPQDE
jgi:hypothetical protein